MNDDHEFQSRHAGAFDLSGAPTNSLEDKLKCLCFEHGYNNVRQALRVLGESFGVEIDEPPRRSRPDGGRARAGRAWETRIRKEIEQAAKEGVKIDEKEASRRVAARMRQGTSDPASPPGEMDAAAA